MSYQISPTVGLLGPDAELVVLTPPAIIFPAFILPETPKPPRITKVPEFTSLDAILALAYTLPFASVYVR